MSKEILETLKEIKDDLNYHIRRTDLLEKQMGWIQWVLPICFTIASVFLAIAMYLLEQL